MHGVSEKAHQRNAETKAGGFLGAKGAKAVADQQSGIRIVPARSLRSVRLALLQRSIIVTNVAAEDVAAAASATLSLSRFLLA